MSKVYTSFTIFEWCASTQGRRQEGPARFIGTLNMVKIFVTSTPSEPKCKTFYVFSSFLRSTKSPQQITQFPKIPPVGESMLPHFPHSLSSSRLASLSPTRVSLPVLSHRDLAPVFSLAGTAPCRALSLGGAAPSCSPSPARRLALPRRRPLSPALGAPRASLTAPRGQVKDFIFTSPRSIYGRRCSICVWMR